VEIIGKVLEHLMAIARDRWAALYVGIIKGNWIPTSQKLLRVGKGKFYGFLSMRIGERVKEFIRKILQLVLASTCVEIRAIPKPTRILILAHISQ